MNLKINSSREKNLGVGELTQGTVIYFFSLLPLLPSPSSCSPPSPPSPDTKNRGSQRGPKRPARAPGSVSRGFDHLGYRSEPWATRSGRGPACKTGAGGFRVVGAQFAKSCVGWGRGGWAILADSHRAPAPPPTSARRCPPLLPLPDFSPEQSGTCAGGRGSHGAGWPRRRRRHGFLSVKFAGKPLVLEMAGIQRFPWRWINRRKQ